MDSSAIFRFAPITLYVLFLVVALGLRILIFVSRTGRNPIAFGKHADRDRADAYIERSIALAFVLVGAIALARALAVETPSELGRLRWLERSEIAWAGVFLATAAAIWTFLAQGAMGASWRIGIPEEERTELVTSGFFRFCRNPIYVGVFIGLAGQFLLTPTTALALVTLYSAALVGIQVRCEEEHLFRAHGEIYRGYASRVGRYTPWFGRVGPRP